ncbi:DUF2339 domain-containing protein [Reichenbachiella carrageenanivorans]|uniref:DUF2339 domain-containing protein n=1 Tax=Reichenbachiella carrageenanivorans TaxID=2979869 RepID=A0ABY6CWX6_9BACT|nr:DUF2339 domain-containing protein [Reichenbachiella carrageenanivorans]UXX78368.1 DUF2339 domain-containing protein [Reichenbachiella carrageenanivorans]
MEGFIVLLLIVLLILLVKLMGRIDKVDAKVQSVYDELKGRSNAVSGRPVAQPLEESPKPVEKPSVAPEEPVVDKTPDVIRQVIAQSQAPQVTPAALVKKKKIKAPPKPSFMERNPDLEKFIGENLMSKIGIVIFVIGMGFLVKLGIDNEVITESMRVAIGVLIGGGMIGLAHYMRTTFSKFSSILIGGALAVLYFTIALAFHEYALLPQTAAFIIMVVITAFGVLLSIAYDRKELAVLAIIGGFGTPFFVSTGSGNYLMLLTYILILDIGMLTLVYFKKWNVINYLAYGFTYVLFIGVYISEFINDEVGARWPLFFFLTGFYLIFFLMTIIYNVKNKRKFKYPEIIMLLTNTSLYFGLGLAIIHGYKEGLLSGLFTAMVAVFNFGFVYTLYKRKDIDKNLLFLLIGLVLTFVSLIAPIQLEGNYITLFWAVEAVLLLWLSQKSGIRLMIAASALITVLMLISLVMDWQHNYYPLEEYIDLSLFLNKAFVASFVAMLSLLGASLLLKQDAVVEVRGVQIIWRALYLRVLLAIVFYFGFLFELNYQFVRFDYQDTHRLILLGIYNFTYVLLILAVYRRQPSELLRKSGFVLSILAVFSYMTFYLQTITDARSFYALDSEASTGFYWHYIMLILFVLILTYLFRDIRQQYTFKSKEGTIFLWVLAFIGVYVCTTEVTHLSVMRQYGTDLDDYGAYDLAIRSVFPVVWTLSALVLMVAGMRLRLKPLRLASLVLFLVTIVKLFFYDLAGNSTGKIISFILLGVILLLTSFLYQKLKFIIQDDEKKE